MSVTCNKLPVTFQEALEIIHDKVDARAWLTPKGHSKKEYSCPFCPSSDAVAAIPDSKGKWKCFSCDKVFDVLDVIQQVEGVSWKEAFKMCCDDAGIEVIRDNDPRNDFSALKDEYLSAPFSTGTPAAPPADLPPLKELCTPEHWKKLHAAALSCEYLTKTRGIPAEVIARHPDGIGFSEQARPPMNPKARVKAVIFRPSRYSYMMRFSDAAQVEKFTYGHKKAVCKATDEQGNRRDELAPHIWNPAALDGGRPVFIVEGILDALSLETVGAEAVALQGTSGIDRLMKELDARRAAGKAVPILLDALDADAPGRKAAKKLKEGAGARGVSVYDGAKSVGSCKDANEALTSDRAAFAAAVKQAEQDAEMWQDLFEPSTEEADRKEAPAVEEVPAAEQATAEDKKESESLPIGSAGIINPDAINTKAVLFLAANQSAVKAILQAGAAAVGVHSSNAAQELFRLLEERKKDGKDIPAAVVDCLDLEAYDRAIVNHVIAPDCEEMGITYKAGAPVMIGANAIKPEDVPAFVAKAVAELEAEDKAEREAYAAETAAARAVNFFAETENVKPFSPTGFSALDAILDGGFYSGLYIVGAISSLGKTTFILQIADYVAAQGQDVLYFSLEMSAYEIMSKSFSRLTHEAAEKKGKPELARPVRDILTGSRRQKLSVEQNTAIFAAVDEYSKSAEHLHIIESVGTKTAEDIRKDVERHHKFTGHWPLVIVDYLQILKAADPHMTDKQATDAAVLTLKQISRDYDIPVFCVSSLNRDNYNNPINMAAFKESGAVEYSADVLLGMQYFGMDIDEKKDTGRDGQAKRRKRLAALATKRKEDIKAGRPVYVQVCILKNRNGMKDNCTLRYYPKYNDYETCDWWEAKQWRDVAEGFPKTGTLEEVRAHAAALEEAYARKQGITDTSKKEMDFIKGMEELEARSKKNARRL